MNGGKGFLAIWSDIARENETDYLHWLTREHVAERLSVPGFLAARVFVCKIREARRYFILYDLSEARVLTSDAYLARLNNPTPWSQRMMPRLTNFRRGGGSVVKKAGYGHGRVANIDELGSLDRLIANAASLTDRVCAVSLLAVDPDSTNISTLEKSLRSGDGSFPHLLVVEALDEEALAKFMARDSAEKEFGRSRATLYELVFSTCAAG